jgi:hypothetical protein
MFVAFVDESGNDPVSKVFAMASLLFCDSRVMHAN